MSSKSLHQPPASADVCTASSPAKTRRKALNPSPVTQVPVLMLDAPTYTNHVYRDSGDFRTIKSSDNAGNSVHLQTPYFPKGKWERCGVWYGSETRIDSTGRKWGRTLDHDYVVDNFGELVAVPA